MEVRENPQLATCLIKDVVESHRGEREGIHQSNLNYCLLKAFYRKTAVEKKIDEKGELTKELGKAKHILFEHLRGHTYEARTSWNGISGTIDMLGKIPVELKTTRAFPNKNGEVNEAYVEQLKTYCVMTGKNRACLIIIHVIPAVIKAYTLKFTNEEINAKAEELIRNRDLLLKATQNNDPRFLPAPRYDWECRYCEYNHVCKGGGKQ
jgi:CRISPR/Cas system-associated exonuclease Cas4 (RecB family)